MIPSAAPLLPAFPDLSMARLSTENLRQIRVHVLYKRPEIPANKVVPAIAVSVTYRKQEKAANPGSTPVSATKPFRIICLQIAPSQTLPRRDSISNSCRISSRQGRSEPEILVRLIRELTMRRPWPYQNRPRQLEFAILERGGRRLLQFGHFQPEIQAIPLAISRRIFATSDVETERHDQAFRWPGQNRSATETRLPNPPGRHIAR